MKNKNKTKIKIQVDEMGHVVEKETLMYFGHQKYIEIEKKESFLNSNLQLNLKFFKL